MHGLRLRIGRWVFAPTLWPTLAALACFLLTVSLGNWQSGRAETKRQLQARHDAALREPPVHLGRELLDHDSLLYRRVEAVGRFDDARTILLDNRVLNGVAGYYVLTPLRVEGSAHAVLVNRGWVAVGPSRQQLPHPPVPPGRVHVEGVAIDPHSRYVELGDARPQGRLWQNLDFERYRAWAGLSLQPVVVLQHGGADDGLRREWPRPDTGVDMHVSYALQWYSLATTLAVLWLIMNLKRQRPGDETTSP